jgi:predicted nuclease with RNAse H fold
VRYCGIVPARGLIQLALLEEVRDTEPPVRLRAVFFEPGSAAQVAAELVSLRDVVVGVGGPLQPPDPSRDRLCDELLRHRGVAPRPFDTELGLAARELSGLGVFAPQVMDAEGPVPEGAFRDAPVFETNPDGVFCALRARRLPARRHPQGVRVRIEELEHEQVLDDGGGLWNRRIEEVDAVAAALCAHRYAVGHAWWVGAADEGVTVVPGASLPGKFSTDGVLAAVERLQLPPV